MRTLPIRSWLLLALAAIFVVPQVATAIALDVGDLVAAAPVQKDVLVDVKQNVSRWKDPAWQQAIERKLAAARLDMVLQDDSGQILLAASPKTVFPGLRLGIAVPAKPDTNGVYVYSQSLPSKVPPQKLVYAQAERTRFRMPSLLVRLLGPDLAGFLFGSLAVPADSALTLKPPTVMALSAEDFQDAQGRTYHVYLSQNIAPSILRLQGLLAPLTSLVALLLTIVVAAWFVGRAILRPLAAMSVAARQIAAGELDFDIPDSRVREVAEVSSAFRAMGDALRDSIYRQAQLEQERRLFISAVVHDLRTPLFSLRGYLEGLADGVANTPEKSERYLAISREKAAALERLVSDLFAYAQMEYLEQSPHREPLDLGALLRRTADGLRPLAEARGIELIIDGPIGTCICTGDEHLLSRALENILDNALRYTPTGGRIVVAWQREPDHVSFSITDSGPGFDPRDLPNVFSPLFRGEASRNRRTGGAGLGLTIARRAVLAHGGDLTAANAPGGGAVLRGILPAAASPDRSDVTALPGGVPLR